MKTFVFLAVIAVTLAAECTPEQLSNLLCPVMKFTSEDCAGISGCTWCKNPTNNIRVCKVKSGKCTCVNGPTSTSITGTCFSKTGPSCTLDISGTNTNGTEGEVCSPSGTYAFSLGKCPVVKSDYYPSPSPVASPSSAPNTIASIIAAASILIALAAF